MGEQNRKLFTDSRAYISGEVNKDHFTSGLAKRIAQSAGLVFRNGGDEHKVIIGKDPRVSSYLIENAMAAGFMDVGMNVLYTGPVPAPGIAMLTQSMRCDLGVMIGAGEEPFEFNGIEIFGPNHQTLSPEVIARIEEYVRADSLHGELAKGSAIGKGKRIDSAKERYVEHVKRSLPSGTSLKNIRVVLDCAHGASYQVAPLAFKELDAEVSTIGTDPNGENINGECGTAHPRAIMERVRYLRADIGFAFDGSGSRLIAVDETGALVMHDALAATFADSDLQDDVLVTALRVVYEMCNEKVRASELFGNRK